MADVHVATGDWTTWTWTSGSWDAPYPREGGRGTLVTARKSWDRRRRVGQLARPATLNLYCNATS